LECLLAMTDLHIRQIISRLLLRQLADRNDRFFNHLLFNRLLHYQLADRNDRFFNHLLIIRLLHFVTNDRIL
jgi:hypothetical protein